MTDEEVYAFVQWYINTLLTGKSPHTRICHDWSKVDNLSWVRFESMLVTFRELRKQPAARIHALVRSGLLIKTRICEGRKYVRLADPRDIVRSKKC